MMRRWTKVAPPGADPGPRLEGERRRQSSPAPDADGESSLQGQENQLGAIVAPSTSPLQRAFMHINAGQILLAMSVVMLPLLMLIACLSTVKPGDTSR